MKKKLTALGTAVLAMVLLTVTVVAANLSAPATITINTTDTKIAELKEAKTVFDVYKIAELSGADYVFDADGPFKDLSVTEEERTDEENAPAKAEELAQQALAIIKDNTVTPEPVAVEAGNPLTGLETGDVYLIVAHGSDLEKADYFDEIPVKNEDGTPKKDAEGNPVTTLVTIAQTADKTYSFKPMLVTLLDEEYELTIDPKYSLKDRYGAIRITKTLSTWDDIGEATFVFRVTGTDAEGATVFSDVAGMTFDGTGRQSVVVDHIPVGTTVTVSEIYSGSQYAQQGSDPAPVLIEDALPVDVEITDSTAMKEAEFVNDHNENEQHGHGITNTFKYNGSSWVWYKDGVVQN